MPTAEQVFNKHNPKHQLNLQWVPNNEIQINALNTTYDHHGRPVVQGGGSSTRVASYTVTVRYTGPENIGERLIKQEVIPNYWTDPGVRNEANSLTNTALAGAPQENYCTKLGNHIKREVTWKNALLCLFCFPCAAISCLFTPCLGVEERDRQQRAQIFTGNLDQVANDKMVLHMAAIVAEADLEVEARVRSLKQNQSQSGGNITLTQEQLQMLLNRSSDSAQLAGNNVPGMLSQYQQHGHQTSLPLHSAKAAVGSRATLN